jgi:hypothetical protein
MTNAAAIKSMREQFLKQSTDAEPNRYEIFAAMAEAYVAKTLETICKIDVANPATSLDPAIAARMAEVRAKLDGLDDLIVKLRELRAEGRG